MAQYITKREWLRLDPKQRTLVYYWNVTSVGKDTPSPSISFMILRSRSGVRGLVAPGMGSKKIQESATFNFSQGSSITSNGRKGCPFRLLLEKRLKQTSHYNLEYFLNPQMIQIVWPFYSSLLLRERLATASSCAPSCCMCEVGRVLRRETLSSGVELWKSMEFSMGP